MSRLDALRADVDVLRQMLRGMPRKSATHAERLTEFYAPQAEHYDRFREKLLHGRAELIASLPVPDGAHIVELGGGTGRNGELFGATLDRIASLEIVDLCQPLLDRARERARHLPKLRVSDGDAATWQPAQPVDCVYFSYSLTMIPAWRSALRNAIGMLKIDGILGVVDFHVSDRHPPPGIARHNALSRWFWPRWFRHDGVQLESGRLATLCDLLPDHELTEAHGSVPYLPLLRVPYYRFVGRKVSVNAVTDVIRK